MLRITQNQLNNFTLSKNFLGVNKANSLEDVLYACVALPADDVRSPGLALKIRLNHQSPVSISALMDGLVWGQFMRCENHLFCPANFAMLHAATARQINRSFNVEWINWGVTLTEIESLGEDVLALLGEQKQSEADLAHHLPNLQTLTYITRGGHIKETTNLALALKWLTATHKLLAKPEQGDTLYARPETWHPALSLEDTPSEAQAQTDLIRAYLTAFGPATESDIEAWAGLSKGERARATGTLFREVTQVMVAGLPGTMLLLKSQAEALQNTPDEVPPLLHLLPPDDAYIKAYKASRSRFLVEPKWQARIFKGSGAVSSVILYQSQIIGTWQWPQADASSPSWKVFTPVTAEVEEAIRQKIETM